MCKQLNQVWKSDWDAESIELKEFGIKMVNKQPQKHVKKGFTLSFWRLIDSSVILEIFQVKYVFLWLLEQTHGMQHLVN